VPARTISPNPCASIQAPRQLRSHERLSCRWRTSASTSTEASTAASSRAATAGTSETSSQREPSLDIASTCACSRPVAPTATARNRQTATNIRQRVLARAATRANEKLQRAGASPLPDGLTLHTLRRTYASLLFAIGRAASEVMAQLGHPDARLTLGNYARVMSQDPGERERLEALVNGHRLVTIGHWSTSSASSTTASHTTEPPETAKFPGVSRVDPAGLEPATSCLPCRRSRVRVPSSASRKGPETGGLCFSRFGRKCNFVTGFCHRTPLACGPVRTRR
jgi:hypothetical protein